MVGYTVAAAFALKVPRGSVPRGTVLSLNYLWIGQHSGVNQLNTDPYRHMVNLKVKSVMETHKTLKEKGVTFIAEPFEALAEKDFYFATFEDPEHNVFQLVGDK